jgi:sulfur dioxygenase
VTLTDLRECSERERHGIVPGSLHVTHPSLQENTRAGGMSHELAKSIGKRLMF